MTELNLQTVDAQFGGERIAIDAQRDELAEAILDGQIVILKDVFDPENLRELRHELFEWSQETPEIESHDVDKESTFHSVDINPEESAHPKVYHSFNFILDTEDSDTDIDSAVRPYFESLRDLQNDLAGTDGEFGDLSGLAMRPIVIHYPRGGGGFPLHTHPFLPQKVGIIVNMSKYGEDYHSGGTRFALPTGDVVDIAGKHDIGDIALWRIDIPHNVYPCDPEAELDFDDPAGRWSMILPYNRF